MRSRFSLILLILLVQVLPGQEISLQLERTVEADLYYPTDICGNENGDVFVLDAMNDRVLEINRNGRVKSIEPERETFYKAVGIACIDGQIWIADTPRGRLLEMSRNGRVNRVVPLETGTEPVDLIKINDRMAVTDRANHRIIILDMNGEQLSSWGERGNDIGEFINPGLMAAGPENRLIITDILNRRVMSYSPSGRFPQLVVKGGASRGTIIRPKGVAFNKANELWVADGYSGSLQLFTLSGRSRGLATLNGQPLDLTAPMGLWIDGNDLIWVVESAGNKVSVYKVHDE